MSAAVPSLYVGNKNFAFFNAPTTSQTNAQQTIKQTAVAWTLVTSGGSLVSSGLSSSTFTAPVGGLYAICHSMAYIPNGLAATTTVQQWLYIIQSNIYPSGNSSSTNNRHGSVAGYATSTGVQLQTIAYLHLAAGDMFSLASYSTGSQVSTSTSTSNELSIELLHFE